LQKTRFKFLSIMALGVSAPPPPPSVAETGKNFVTKSPDSLTHPVLLNIVNKFSAGTDLQNSIILNKFTRSFVFRKFFNQLNAELNPIRHLLALAGAHLFVHVSRVRVNSNLKTYMICTTDTTDHIALGAQCSLQQYTCRSGITRHNLLNMYVNK
jgi:hypothetical protein